MRLRLLLLSLPGLVDILGRATLGGCMVRMGVVHRVRATGTDRTVEIDWVVDSRSACDFDWYGVTSRGSHSLYCHLHASSTVFFVTSRLVTESFSELFDGHRIYIVVSHWCGCRRLYLLWLLLHGLITILCWIVGTCLRLQC